MKVIRVVRTKLIQNIRQNLVWWKVEC